MNIKHFPDQLESTCEDFYYNIGGKDLEMFLFSGRLYDLDEEEESLIEVSR